MKSSGRSRASLWAEVLCSLVTSKGMHSWGVW